MDILTLDFETYFDDAYTLSKMTIEAYIRDPRFAPLGVGLRMPSGQLVWCSLPERGPDGPFAAIDWDETACLCHHAQFDGLILSHHYGVMPARWYDTLSMARYLGLPGGLDALGKRFGPAPKSVPYDSFKGRQWATLPPQTQRELADGCLHDVEMTWTIFNRMMTGDY